MEAIMWRVGREADLRMTIGNLLILDRLPPREEVVRRVARAAEAAPRLQWRPDDQTGARIRPAWVEDDGSFDAEQHVRSLTAPAGDQRQMLDLVALLESTPFTANRPPWDVTLIDGIDGGRAAIYLRAHHVVCDGLGGVWLTSLLLDAPSPVSAPPPEAERADPQPTADTPPTARRRGAVTVTLDLRDVVRPLAAGMNAAVGADALDGAVRKLQQGVDLLHSVSHQIVLGLPLSLLPSSGSTVSRYETVSVPRARSTALALGGSRNDLLVTVAAAALGRYHDRLGLPCPELRLATPTTRARDGGAAGNSFAPLRVQIPTASATRDRTSVSWRHDWRTLGRSLSSA